MSARQPVQLIRNADKACRNEVLACTRRARPSLRINKDRLSPVLACNYDGTKPGIPWIGDPSYLARRRGSPLGQNQFGINVTSRGINVESCRTGNDDTPGPTPSVRPKLPPQKLTRIPIGY